MDNQKQETWVKIGQYEHNLPPGRHVIYSRTYDTEKLTKTQLEYLEKKGCKHVRKAAKQKTTQTEDNTN